MSVSATTVNTTPEQWAKTDENRLQVLAKKISSGTPVWCTAATLTILTLLGLGLLSCAGYGFGGHHPLNAHFYFQMMTGVGAGGGGLVGIAVITGLFLRIFGKDRMYAILNEWIDKKSYFEQEDNHIIETLTTQFDLDFYSEFYQGFPSIQLDWQTLIDQGFITQEAAHLIKDTLENIQKWNSALLIYSLYPPVVKCLKDSTQPLSEDSLKYLEKYDMQRYDQAVNTLKEYSKESTVGAAPDFQKVNPKGLSPEGFRTFIRENCATKRGA